MGPPWPSPLCDISLFKIRRLLPVFLLMLLSCDFFSKVVYVLCKCAIAASVEFCRARKTSSNVCLFYSPCANFQRKIEPTLEQDIVGRNTFLLVGINSQVCFASLQLCLFSSFHFLDSRCFLLRLSIFFCVFFSLHMILF